MSRMTYIFCMACLFVFLCGVLTAIMLALDLPDVYVSNGTGECVAVMSHKNDGGKEPWSCSNLPKRYNKVFVY